MGWAWGNRGDGIRVMMKFSSLGNLGVFCHSSLRKRTCEEANKFVRDLRRRS